MNKPRKPNRQEITQLAGYIHYKFGHGENLKEAELVVKDTCIAVFDDYISGGPGYAGKLMMVVWLWPAAYEVYIWEDGELTHVNQDHDWCEEEEDWRQ
jgi:hypothetical protein